MDWEEVTHILPKFLQFVIYLHLSKHNWNKILHENLAIDLLLPVINLRFSWRLYRHILINLCSTYNMPCGKKSYGLWASVFFKIMYIRPVYNSKQSNIILYSINLTFRKSGLRNSLSKKLLFEEN